MKKINSYKYSLFIAILFITSRCSTDDNSPKNNSTTLIKTVINTNTEVNIQASEDYIVILPSNNIRLSRSYTYAGNIDPVDSFVWKKYLNLLTIFWKAQVQFAQKQAN